MDSSSMHKVHMFNFQKALHHYGHITFCEMLSWQYGAEKLGMAALAKLCEEEKPKEKTSFLA